VDRVLRGRNTAFLADSLHACSCASTRQPLRPLTGCTLEILVRLSVLPVPSEEKRGPPRFPGRPFLRAEVEHPARCDLPSAASLAGKSPSTSGNWAPWAFGMVVVFVSAVPRPARSRVYASPATSPCPSQDSRPAGAVLPLAGRGSQPLGEMPKFLNSSHHSLISDQPILVARIQRRPRARRRTAGSWMTKYGWPDGFHTRPPLLLWMTRSAKVRRRVPFSLWSLRHPLRPRFTP